MADALPLVPARVKAPPTKRIGIFLDGTWNTVDDNTNVWRLKSLTAPLANGLPQVTYYDIGVNGAVGGGVGKGLGENVLEAYKWLIDNYEEEDEIFIFGFSRGAYTARSLAGFIAMYGILKPGAPLSVKQLYARYQRDQDRTIWKLCELRDTGQLGVCSLEEQWMLKYSVRADIKMVGVWDTVGAIGIPVGRWKGVSRSTLNWLHTGLRKPIQHGFHALAIDDHRKSFAPTLWTIKKYKDPQRPTRCRDIASVEQRWFVGAHGNVGGGCESDLLAQFPLRWMMRKAAGLGFGFRNDIDIDGDVLKAPVSDSYDEFLWGLYSRVSQRHQRPIGAPPRENADGWDLTTNETIDASVFERWRLDPHYRPAGIASWAKARGVDPAQITQSVRADAPDQSVP
jgi:uncharacterized protein (DUF2235 family)